MEDAFRRELALLPLEHLDDALAGPARTSHAVGGRDPRMEAQHGRVEELVQQLSGLIDRWGPGADPAVTQELAATIDELRAALLEHLDDEEEHILPIAARSMSPQEWEAVGQHGFSEIDRADLPILFGMLIEDATPEERKEMFARLPLPARMYLRTVGAWQYRRYIKAVRET